MTAIAIAAPAAITNAQKIGTIRAQLNAAFLERAHIIDGLLLALLSGEHAFLLGPPGGAKSQLVRAVASSFGVGSGTGRYFEMLLTKTTTPEEVFGPYSLSGLEKDLYERVVAGTFVECEIGFLDELLRGSSAILNALLSAINERTFKNGTQMLRLPLMSVMSAANSIPESNDLEAFFDRFLIRLDVRYLQQNASRKNLLMAGAAGGGAPVPAVASTAELRTMRQEVAAVRFTDDTADCMLTCQSALAADGIIASDRRWFKLVRVVQASAYMAGATETAPEDVLVCTDGLWREPKERGKIASIVGGIADPASVQCIAILDAARETSTRVAKIPRTDRKVFISAGAEARDEFAAQSDKLDDLAKSSGRRAKVAIADALAEIRVMHDEISRSLAEGMGLRRGR